ncbi:hypothetical protein [Nostoc sp.]|uniref:hypothetical protein n=1 Tax=Nostoc sp. TaxID=1180 RepID=UPI002FFB53F8
MRSVQVSDHRRHRFVVKIYESNAYGGLRLRTCVLDRGATKFQVPQHDFGVPQHDFGVPQHDFGVPQHDFGVPQHDFEVSVAVYS